jgi:polysaccharide biosynthesis protein PslH
MRLPHTVFLTHHHPWRGVGGGRLRERELLDRICHEYRVTVLAVCKAPGDLEGGDLGCPLPVTTVPAEQAPLLDVLSPLEARHHSRVATERVAGLVASRGADLVHFEGHYLCRLLPQRLPAPLVVAENNIESDLVRQRRRLADAESAPALDRALLTTIRSERRAWSRADAVVTVTEADRDQAQRLVSGTPVHVVPDGVDHLGLPSDAAERGDEVLFMANWAYEPNLDAARWLLEEIGPRLARAVPGVVVHFAGAGAPGWLAAEVLARPWARLTTPVGDVGAMIDGASVVLCPLRVGGGVKVKVLEGMRRGKPVVTTPVGAQGIEGAEALRVADGAVELAAAATELLLDPGRRAEARRAVRLAAAGLPSWSDAAAALDECWARTLQAAGGAARRASTRAPA